MARFKQNNPAPTQSCISDRAGSVTSGRIIKQGLLKLLTGKAGPRPLAGTMPDIPPVSLLRLALKCGFFDHMTWDVTVG